MRIDKVAYEFAMFVGGSEDLGCCAVITMNARSLLVLSRGTSFLAF